MRLDYAFWPDVEEYLKREDRLLVPAGAVEQHGPAVAMGIDYLIAAAVADAAAERLALYAAPPLIYGMSLHHAAFAGTASLKPSSYLHMLVDLLGFFVRHGFRRIVLLNGHGGNVPSLKAAAAEVSYENEGARILICSWYETPEVKRRVEEEFGPDEGSHATPSEVSVLMHLRPELVGDLSAVARTEKDLIRWHPGPWDLRAYYPQGAVGSDARRATPALGKELFDLAVEGAVEAMGLL